MGTGIAGARGEKWACLAQIPDILWRHGTTLLSNSLTEVLLRRVASMNCAVARLGLQCGVSTLFFPFVFRFRSRVCLDSRLCACFVFPPMTVTLNKSHQVHRRQLRYGDDWKLDVKHNLGCGLFPQRPQR